MKKNITFFFSTLLFIFFYTSCDKSTMSPSVFEQTLIDYVQKTHLEEEVVQNAISRIASAGGGFSRTKTETDYLLAINNTKDYLSQVKTIKAPDGGENLKQAVISYLNAVIVMLNACKPLFSINENTSMDQIRIILTDIVEKEGIAAKAFQEIQKEQDLFDGTKK